MNTGNDLGMEFIKTDGTTTVRLSGRLDSATAPMFQEKAVEECAGGPAVLDLSDLRYISSAGLRAIMVLRRSGSQVTVVNPSGLVKEVLEVSGFQHLEG